MICTVADTHATCRAVRFAFRVARERFRIAAIPAVAMPGLAARLAAAGWLAG